MLDYILARIDRDEEGQTMTEYAVVLAVIVVMVLAVGIVLNDGISGAVTEIIGEITSGLGGG